MRAFSYALWQLRVASSRGDGRRLRGAPTAPLLAPFHTTMRRPIFTISLATCTIHPTTPSSSFSGRQQSTFLPVSTECGVDTVFSVLFCTITHVAIGCDTSWPLTVSYLARCGSSTKAISSLCVFFRTQAGALLEYFYLDV